MHGNVLLVVCQKKYDRTFTDDGLSQTFVDGKRLLAGTNIIECTSNLVDAACTPDQVHIYPIRWNTTTNATGPGGNIRELRLHPDNVHLGFNSFTILAGRIGQYGYMGRLQFSPVPTWGTPLSPRYDLVNVYRLFDPQALQPVTVDRKNSSLLHINPQSVTVGELRGFSGTGREVTYIGFPAESSNIDVFAADLTTGKVRRLTSHPEYVDPVDISPDDQWTVVMDTRVLEDRCLWLVCEESLH
jgi:WD40 repeat protein